DHPADRAMLRQARVLRAAPLTSWKCRLPTPALASPVSRSSLRRSVSPALPVTISCLVELRSVASLFLQDLARFELVVALREFAHFIDNPLQTEMFREPQRSTPMRRKASPENHSVIGVLG